MICQRCQAELLDGKPFCHRCGTRIAHACRTCNALLGDDFLYCATCGTATAGVSAANDGAQLAPTTAVVLAAAKPSPSAPNLPNVPDVLAQKVRASKKDIEGERKQVTVLFCDIAGSTALAERLDAEEYRELLDQYLELAFRAIYRHEGLVNQIAGDGFMALFGAPVAHEDAPQRAVHAALEIQQALAALNEALDVKRGLRLRARIGIHTGPVVVGSVGNDLKMDYSAIGDTTNLAARLEALAEPGTVLVSETTYRLVRARFDAEEVGPLTVKGKLEPITAYIVIAMNEAARLEPQAPLALGADRTLTPFVGRHAELAQLVSCYERLDDRLPQLTTIVGPPGSGKSRLLYEFKDRLQTKPVTWFEVRCSAWTQMLPYAPFAGMLRRYFGVTVDDGKEQVREKLERQLRQWDPDLDQMFPWFCRILSINDDGLELSEDEMKRGMFTAMSMLMYRSTDRGPVILLIEDMHWLDDPSRDMLYAAAEQMFSWPFMLLVSHRHDFHPLWRTPTVLTQINLRPLDDNSIADIIRSVAGSEISDDLNARIRTKAEGSPFLAEEITRSLVEDGSLTHDLEHQHAVQSETAIRIPNSVQEVLAARLDRLSPEAKRVAQVAAVLGRQFNRPLLVELLTGEDIDIEFQLDELEHRGIVHRRNIFSKDEYRFGESMTQEVAYEGLLLRQRRQLHERIGELLLSAPGTNDAERSTLLVYHFTLSDSPAKAIQALLNSAAEAEKLPSYATAARLYRQAWDIACATLDKGDTSFQHLALKAVSGIGRMQRIYSVPDPGDNALIFSRAREFAEALQDHGTLAGLLNYEGMSLLTRGREHFAAALATLESGLNLAHKDPNPLPGMSVLRTLAHAYMLDGRLRLAENTFDELLDQLPASGNATPNSDIYCSTRWMRDRVYFFNDEFDRSLLSSDETLDLAERVGNRTIRFSAGTLIGHIAFYRGDYAEALRQLDEVWSLVAGIGQHINAAVAAAVTILAKIALGHRDGFDQYLKCILDRTEPSYELALSGPVVTEALLATDELLRAESRARLAYERTSGRLRETHALLALAAVYLRKGEKFRAEAATYYAEASAFAQTLGLRSALAHARSGEAEIAAAAGDTQSAAALFSTAELLWRNLGMRHYESKARDSIVQLGEAAHSR